MICAERSEPTPSPVPPAVKLGMTAVRNSRTGTLYNNVEALSNLEEGDYVYLHCSYEATSEDVPGAIFRHNVISLKLLTFFFFR